MVFRGQSYRVLTTIKVRRFAATLVLAARAKCSPRTVAEAMKTLMVPTSHEQLGDTGKKSGFWLEASAAPFHVLTDAGA